MALNAHQIELLSIVRIARSNLANARKTTSAETTRRINAYTLQVQQEAARAISLAETQIRIDVDAEIAQHESALDDSLIAAYNNEISGHDVAVHGFGLRYDGTVTALYRKLREDGRLGNKAPGRKATTPIKTMFPAPLDAEGMIDKAVALRPPMFEDLGDEEFGDDFILRTVKLTLDISDPYFAEIAPMMRVGLNKLLAEANTATLYLAYDGKIASRESSEVAYPDLWDHAAARWVLDHQDEARAGYNAATAE